MDDAQPPNGPTANPLLPAPVGAERYLDSLAPLGLDGSKPFWRSTTLQGLGVLIASRILRHFAPALHVSDGDLTDVVQYALEIGGALMVLVGRVKARKDILPLFLGVGTAALVALMFAGCAGNSPFTPASAPAAGKIPVRVVLGTQASGNTADPARGTDYSASGQVVFGQGQPWYRRFLSLFTHGPLTPEDEARWDADLRNEAAATVPHIGVVHYPGEAP